MAGQLTNVVTTETSGTLQVVLSFNEKGRLFSSQERYTYDQKVEGDEVCGPCGNRFIEHRTYYRVNINGEQYMLRSDWVTPISPAEVPNTTFDDRRYEVANSNGGDINGNPLPPAPDTYRPEAEKARFDGLAKDRPMGS